MRDVRSLAQAEVAIASILAAGLWALQSHSWRPADPSRPASWPRPTCGLPCSRRLIVCAMNYKGIEYVVRARPGRDQWTFVISYPPSANPTEVRFSGSRDEAIAAACRRIDGWLKRQRTTEARR